MIDLLIEAGRLIGIFLIAVLVAALAIGLMSILPPLF